VDRLMTWETITPGRPSISCPRIRHLTEE